MHQAIVCEPLDHEYQLRLHGWLESISTVIIVISATINFLNDLRKFLYAYQGQFCGLKSHFKFCLQTKTTFKSFKPKHELATLQEMLMPNQTGSRLWQVMFVKNFDMYLYPRISKSSLKCFK